MCICARILLKSNTKETNKTEEICFEFERKKCQTTAENCMGIYVL